jgi:hypothetical protein
VISRVTRNSSFRAASPLGNAPFVFTTLRTCCTVYYHRLPRV